MTLVASMVAASIVTALTAADAPAVSQQGVAPPAERQLDEALADLQRRGLRVIFSSEVVRPTMRVATTLRPSSLRRELDALLEPHGLIAQDGPAGTLVVVRNHRARPVTPTRPRPLPGAAASEAAMTAPQRYEETIQVIDDATVHATVGPQAVALAPLDVRDFAGGFDNVFRVLASLPGVTGTDELGSRIAVRGGSPDQNLTVMDGIEIHNPYRLVVSSEDLALVGLASMFNPDTVERVEFSPGAFDVRYGDRLSSLLVVKNREGSTAERFQGAASAGLGDASLTIEGRAPHLDGSWLVSARRTYLGLLAERVTGTAFPTFTDVQARATWRPHPGRRLSAVVMAARERLDGVTSSSADASATAATNNALAGVTFETSLGGRTVSRTVLSASGFADRLDARERSFDNSRGANSVESVVNGALLQFAVRRDVRVQDLALRHDVAIVPTAAHWIDAGAEVHALDTGWLWRLTGDRSLQQANTSSIRLGHALPDQLESSRRTWRAGLWLADRWQVKSRLTLEPGVRIDRSALTQQVIVAPRLGAALRLGESWRVDAAIRLHAQSPGYEKMLQSDYFVNLGAAAPGTLVDERALQTTLGLRRSLGRGFSVGVDGYYRRLRDLVAGRLETSDEVRQRLATYDVPADLWSAVSTAPQVTTEPVNAGRGRTYGIEAQVTRQSGSGVPASGWLTYSYGRAERVDYGVERPFDYDRRHGLSAAASLRLGPRLDVSLTGRVASGLPRTPVQGVKLSLARDDADADGDGNLTEYRPLRDAAGAPLFQPDYGDTRRLNTARLPRFARLDARVTYRPAWGGERWAFFLDVINLLNTKNITQVDTVLAVDPGADRPRIREVTQDRGLPVLPSLGLRFWF